jgi:hypothetical protein
MDKINDLTSNYIDIHESPLGIKRRPHSRPTFLEGIDVKLKTVDFVKIKKTQEEAKERLFEELEKTARGNKNTLILLKSMVDQYEKHTGQLFVFRKQQLKIITDQDGTNTSTKILSDYKRLRVVMEAVIGMESNLNVQKLVVCEMIDRWYSWEKSAPNNLVGFLENQTKNGLDQVVFAAKKKSKVSGVKAVLSESRRVESVENQRRLFG